MKKFISVMFAATLAASPAFAGMTASFTWGPTTKCDDLKSPPFKISGVPKGTASLHFNMVDLDNTEWLHGGGTVVYTGQATIPYGAFTQSNYSGPCTNVPHMYEFTITALDKNGKELAKTVARKKFSQ